ncbi:MAG: cupin domain-containing protein, partial [Planctomycetota bacterium]|nr:cupin domain-containing protein [Planctomycetota bacterium]
AIVPWHDHPHEQMGILISGQLLFEIGDEKLTLQAGDCWRIPGGVPHTCQAGEDSVRAIDIFSPVREDYL